MGERPGGVRAGFRVSRPSPEEVEDFLRETAELEANYYVEEGDMDYLALAVQLARHQQQLAQMGKEGDVEQHTPGPWKVDSGSEGGTVIRDATGFEICEPWHFLISAGQANARLIAAAPELLEACLGACNPTGHTDQCMENRSIGVPHCSKVCQRLRAAIAKATGGAPTDPFTDD